MTCYHGERRSGTWPQMQSLAHQVNQQMNRNIRVGDAERDDAAQALGEHFARGRLDRDEYDERLEAVFSARTGGDLAAAFRDLPDPRPGQRRPAIRPVRHQSRVPFLPILMILVGVMIFTGAWWVMWVGLGVFLLTRRFGRTRQRSRAVAPFRG